MKQSTTVVIPAAGALYFALAQIWHLPKAEEVVGSLAAINTFLGVLMGVSTKSYNKSANRYAGVVEVEETQDAKLLSFELDESGTPLEQRDEAVFKVKTHSTGEIPMVRQPLNEE